MKNPSTGLGAPAVFGGLTFSRTYTNWMGFVTSGYLFTTAHNNYQAGDSYFYQLGIGRNLITKQDHYIFAFLLELDGQYTDYNKYFKLNDPNSGGNILFFTPSLWFSNNQWIVQFGFGVPATQTWNGIQNKVRYFSALSIGLTL